MSPLLVIARLAVLLLAALFAILLLVLLVGEGFVHGAPAPTWDRHRLQETRWQYEWCGTPYLLILHADGSYEDWQTEEGYLSWHGTWEWDSKHGRLVLHDRLWKMDLYAEPVAGEKKSFPVMADRMRIRFVLGYSGSYRFLTFTRVPFKR